MIISRTPFRISFTGGGTDLAEFYRHERGEVLATSINKYMYITVNPRFDHTIRVSYARTEIVSTVDEIQHPIVREALRLVGIDQGIEITSTDRIFKRHFSAGPAGAQPPWNTPAAMWRIVFTPRRRWVGQ